MIAEATITKREQGQDINAKFGKLHRLLIETAEGFSGQAWVKDSSSFEKSYPVGQKKVYRLTEEQFGGQAGYKFAPAKSEEIEEFKKNGPAMPAVVPTVQAPGHTESSLKTQLACAALQASCTLAAADLIKLEQLEKSSRKLLSILTGLIQS